MSIASVTLSYVRDVRFPTADIAESVLIKMKDMVYTYESVTLRDFYTFAEVKPHSEYVNGESIDSVGWRSLISAHTYSANGVWFIDLPTPVVLNKDVLMTAKPEEVDHPNHYQSETGLEAIDVIEAFTFDLKGIEAFCTGNALKYLCRWKGKNGKTDLEKARWYINRLIDHIEKLEKENE